MIIKVQQDVKILKCDFCGKEDVHRTCTWCNRDYCFEPTCDSSYSDIKIYQEITGNYNDSICKECMDNFKSTIGIQLYKNHNMINELCNTNETLYNNFISSIKKYERNYDV